MSSVEVDQLLGRDTVTMSVTYDKGWKMPTTLSKRMFMEHRNTRNSIMTIKLWANATVLVIRCGSIVQQFRKGTQLNSISLGRARLR